MDTTVGFELISYILNLIYRVIYAFTDYFFILAGGVKDGWTNMVGGLGAFFGS
jgi:hypothetical protein